MSLIKHGLLQLRDLRIHHLVILQGRPALLFLPDSYAIQAIVETELRRAQIDLLIAIAAVSYDGVTLNAHDLPIELLRDLLILLYFMI